MSSVNWTRNSNLIVRLNLERVLVQSFERVANVASYKKVLRLSMLSCYSRSFRFPLEKGIK